jgi:hypothetical protein
MVFSLNAGCLSLSLSSGRRVGDALGLETHGTYANGQWHGLRSHGCCSYAFQAGWIGGAEGDGGSCFLNLTTLFRAGGIFWLGL